jgi:hypothetical protein
MPTEISKGDYTVELLKTEEHLEGQYNSAEIWVPECTYQSFCVSRDSMDRSHFCACLLRIGPQELDGVVKIYCDKLEDVNL